MDNLAGEFLPVTIESVARRAVLTVRSSGPSKDAGVEILFSRKQFDGTVVHAEGVFGKSDIICLAYAILNSKGVDVLT